MDTSETSAWLTVGQRFLALFKSHFLEDLSHFLDFEDLLDLCDFDLSVLSRLSFFDSDLGPPAAPGIGRTPAFDLEGFLDFDDFPRLDFQYLSP